MQYRHLTFLVVLLIGSAALLSACSETSDQSNPPTAAQKPTSPAEASAEHSLSINGSAIPLDFNEHLPETLTANIPRQTTVKLDASDPINNYTAAVIFADDTEYIVAINGPNRVIISYHRYDGAQLCSAEIIDPNAMEGYSDFNYYLLTPKDIRVHRYQSPEDPNRSEAAYLEPAKEAYSHFQRTGEDKLVEVVAPKTIIDYFAILPNAYLFQYFNAPIALFPDLSSGHGYYHTYVSKSMEPVVDVKNGYVKLISEMAMFNSADGPIFLLTNSAGGTCETFLFNYFLRFNPTAKTFAEIPHEKVLPEIDRYALYNNPALIAAHRQADEIGLKLEVPRHGTRMQVGPFIDECDIENAELLEAITKTKPITLSWNRNAGRFE